MTINQNFSLWSTCYYSRLYRRWPRSKKKSLHSVGFCSGAFVSWFPQLWEALRRPVLWLYWAGCRQAIVLCCLHGGILFLKFYFRLTYIEKGIFSSDFSCKICVLLWVTKMHLTQAWLPVWLGNMESPDQSYCLRHLVGWEQVRFILYFNPILVVLPLPRGYLTL
jgi:hypothetical protein